MSKDYRRRNQISEQFTWRKLRMLESPAFRVLNLTEHRVLARIEIELRHHGGFDNGKLPVTFADFEAYGVGNRRCTASGIRVVCALGFVERTAAGRAGNREFRTPNKFRLTYQPVDRAKETDEWARIQTIEQAEAIAKAARAARKPRRRKQVSSGGSRTFSVAESGTESADSLVAKSHHTLGGDSAPTFDMSGGVSATHSCAASPPGASSKGGGRREAEGRTRKYQNIHRRRGAGALRQFDQAEGPTALAVVRTAPFVPRPIAG
jgi:hypothetical protein